jgi:hypothetical protein
MPVWAWAPNRDAVTEQAIDPLRELLDCIRQAGAEARGI